MKKKDTYIYTALFFPDDGAIGVSFPDFPQINTFGGDMAEALEMAQEALYAYLDMAVADGDKIPDPTPPAAVKPPQGGFTSLITVDMNAMKAKYSNKAVKKTLTIPEWLNSMAESRQINFSATLQKALREELGV